MTNRRLFESIVGRTSVRVAAGVLPLAAAVLCAEVSLAGPGQPGDTPDGQPGSTSAEPQAAPAPAPAPKPAPAPAHHAPVIYHPHHSAPAPAAPPGPPPSPFAAPAGMVRIGSIMMPAPDWMPSDVRGQINSTNVSTEQQVATVAQSMGVPSNQTNHIADTVTTYGVGGFAAGAVPGAVVGAVPGLLVGAVIGALCGLPFLVVGAVPGLVAGAVAGASVGAALGGAVTGVPLGMAPGALVGAATGLVGP